MGKRRIELPKIVFLVVVGVLTLSSFMAIINANALIWDRLLFSNIYDSFMDFYNSIFYSYQLKPYDLNSIYPAGAHLIFYFCSLFIPKEVNAAGAFYIRNFYGGQLVFLLYNIVSIALFTHLIKRVVKGSDLYSALVEGVLLISLPFIYLFSRGNIIFIALNFSFLFIVLKDHENPLVRELSYIFLALAASIKIYPALFGLLLLDQRRFKDALRTLVYGIVIFSVPFIFTGGFKSFLVFIQSILQESSLTENYGFAYKVNLTTILRSLFLISGFSEPNLHLGIVSIFVFMGSIVSSFFLTTEWKKYLIYSLIIILLPSISFTYSLVFLSIPIAYFMKSERASIKGDLFYAILLALSISSFAFINDDFLAQILPSFYRVNISTLISNISLLILFSVLNLEGFNSLRKHLKCKYQ